MSKSIFSLSQHRQNLSRNAFDLSRKALLTAPSGALLPVFVQEVQPNDHVKIDMASFTRTAPVNSAAYVRINEDVDFYFVPYRLLWSFWPQFIAHTADYNSLLQSRTFMKNLDDYRTALTPETVPVISGNDIYERYFSGVVKKSVKEGRTFNEVTSPYKDYVGEQGDLFGVKRKYNAARLLNLLGYGIDGIKVDDHNAEDEAKPPIDRSVRGGFGGRRIGTSFSAFKKESFNPFRLLAYQRIFNDFYRRTDYLGTDVGSFNIDTSKTRVDRSQINSILELRYRPLKRDYFTNVYPSNLWSGGLNDAAHLFSGIDTDNPRNVLAQVNNFLGLPPLVGVQSSDTATPGGTVVGVQQKQIDSGNGHFSGVLTTASMRNAYAVEKLLSLMNAAGKTYNAQMRARWGITSHDDHPDHAIYLGSHNSKIQINEIVSTADGQNGSTQSSLGEIVGRGLGANDGHVLDFDAKEHGVIMGIYSNYAESLYNSHSVDPFNIKFGFADYYQPEFDNLGMQPLLSSTVFNDDETGHSYIGWQPRYSEYKTCLDKVYGAFQSNGTKSFWTSPLLVESFTLSKRVLKNPNSPNPPADVVDSRPVTIRDLSVNPHTLESVFPYEYDGSTNTDYFLVDLAFDVKKVSSMSVLGDPILN